MPPVCCRSAIIVPQPKLGGGDRVNFAQEHLPSALCLTVYLPNLDDLELG